jgi:hypothetical protein
MHEVDILALSETLQDLYGERFPGLTPTMAEIWLDDLVHLDDDLVRAGLRRWVRFHTHKAPSLDELLESVEQVRDEQVRLPRMPSEKSITDILQEAAETQAMNDARPPEAGEYAHLMVLLAARHIDRWLDDQGVWHDRLTYREMADQCFTWAYEQTTQRPQLSEDLLVAAHKYRGFDNPGDDDIPF